MDEVILSIITPFHNIAMDIFDATKRSVLSVLQPDWEWIIVLHNTDTIDIDTMRDLFKDYPHVKIIEKRDKAFTPSSPRNTGLLAAAGRYVYFLDGDDVVNGPFLVKAINKMEADGFDVVIGKADCKSDSDQVFEVPLQLDFPVVADGYLVPRDPDIMGKLLYGAPMMLACKVIRREIIAKNKIAFDEDILLTEDMLFSFECYLKAAKICVLGDTTAYTYVQHGDSLLQSMMSKKGYTADDYLKPVRKIVNLALQNGISPGAYIWTMLGMFGAIAGNADMEPEKKTKLMAEIQKYLPYVKPSQMRTNKTFVSKQFEVEHPLNQARVEENICSLINEYNETAQMKIGQKTVSCMYKNIAHLSAEQAQSFIHGFQRVLEEEKGPFSAAVFITEGGRSIVLLKISLVLAKALGMDHIMQAMIQ